MRQTIKKMIRKKRRRRSGRGEKSKVVNKWY
jgi:hypothetical protein